MSKEYFYMQHDIGLAFCCDSKPFGMSFSEWTIRWWKWLIAIPKSRNPALDEDGTNCGQNQFDKNAWFLAGTAVPLLSGKRACVIPLGRAILFPIINNLVSYSEYPGIKNDDELKEMVGRDLRNDVAMELRVNDKFATNEACRIGSDPFEIVYPYDNLFNSISGPSAAVSDGFWTFLKPLPKGIHSIYFRASEPNHRTEVHYTLKIE
jgi:hypothetical protein